MGRAAGRSASYDDTADENVVVGVDKTARANVSQLRIGTRLVQIISFNLPDTGPASFATYDCGVTSTVRG